MPAPLFGQEHADRYRETDGEEGHDWQGTTVLLLTTTGRKSGEKRTTPLIWRQPARAGGHPRISAMSHSPSRTSMPSSPACDPAAELVGELGAL